MYGLLFGNSGSYFNIYYYFDPYYSSEFLSSTEDHIYFDVTNFTLTQVTEPVTAPVLEPSTLLLLGGGLAGLVLARRRKARG
jgi:hypothetical protein